MALKEKKKERTDSKYKRKGDILIVKDGK